MRQDDTTHEAGKPMPIFEYQWPASHSRLIHGGFATIVEGKCGRSDHMPMGFCGHWERPPSLAQIPISVDRIPLAPEATPIRGARSPQIPARRRHG